MKNLFKTVTLLSLFLPFIEWFIHRLDSRLESMTEILYEKSRHNKTTKETRVWILYNSLLTNIIEGDMIYLIITYNDNFILIVLSKEDLFDKSLIEFDKMNFRTKFLHMHPVRTTE